MIDHAMLTTVDNPYSPFKQWDEWLAYDESRGHNTCALLSRVCHASEVIEDHAIAYAMRDIAHYNVSGVHMVVTETEFTQLIAVDPALDQVYENPLSVVYA